MSRRELVYSPLAQAEALEAAVYYEGEKPRLGDRFLAQLDAAVKRVEAQPYSWSKYLWRTRVCKMKRFPYGVVYRVHRDRLVVIAVADLRRKQGYWKDRLL